MTALRMRARDFLTEDQLHAVRQRSTWKGAALIAHAKANPGKITLATGPKGTAPYMAAELFATTFTPGSCDRRFVRLSVMPSDRYS